MAQVTVELRNLLNTDFELFDFEYQFDDKKFAKELEQAVIDYYYFYEICDMPDRFKHYFKRRWLSLAGYYNKLHNTTLLEYNPLINHKMSEALEQLSKSNSTQDNTTSSNSEGTVNTENNDNISSSNTRTDNLQATSESSDTTSDYPQQAIAGGDFLSGQRLSDNSTTNTGTVKDTGTSNNDSVGKTTSSDSMDSTGKTTVQGTDNTSYEKTIEGLTGITYQDLIIKERENLIRISQMVIEELKPCFILVH